jgi:hypothetical protein
MKASYIKTGFNYIPAIIHPGGRRETLHGEPLATPAKARFYARLEISARGQAAFRAAPRNPFDGM